MKCANCGHDHRVTNPCPVVVDNPQITRASMKTVTCGCEKFVEPEDAPVCEGCGEVLRFSQSARQLIDDYPYLFICLWCTSCKRIVTAQITVMLPPISSAGKQPAKSNIHVPGGPL